MDKRTTEIQNWENMSAKEARNYIRKNAEEQKKIVDFAGDKYKQLLAKVFREANHNNPKLQQAKKINSETLETIRNYAAAKLNKKVEELTLEEWQQAVRDFYKENDAVDSEGAAEDNSEEKEKKSRELPAGLPDYAYEVDKNFKNETRDGRNPEMMKKIDEVVLKMREEGIIETKSKDGGVYTTINFPGEAPIHFLEPDLTKHSDEKYKDCYDYPLGGERNIHKNEVRLWGMRGDVDKWENKKLKQYVKQSGLHLPKQSNIKSFMQKLSDFVYKKYQLNISNEEDMMDLFCRAMNSIGIFWLADYQKSSRSSFICYGYGRWFGSLDGDFRASFFLTDYLF